jgi:hypothetical protein
MRIVTKHGFKKPTEQDLNNYELGYSVDEQTLYIKDPVNGIVKIGYNIDKETLKEVLADMNITGINVDADLSNLNLKLDGAKLSLLNDKVALSTVDFSSWFDGGTW